MLFIFANMYYVLDITLDDILKTYQFDVTCQGSVPQAIEAFLESNSFIDAIRNATSIGGDSNIIAAMTGSIAEAYYGIPDHIRNIVVNYFLDNKMKKVLEEFEEKYPQK